MIDFPVAPAAGQHFDAPNGVLYIWQDVPGLWLAVSGTTSLPVISKTAAYEVLPADDGERFDNRGAMDAVAFALPTALGKQVSFVKEIDLPVVIKAPPDVAIVYGEQVSMPGGTLTAGGVGSAVMLTRRVAGFWVAEAYNGSWEAA